MSAAGKILERLEGVKRTGDGRWTARCPAHDDRSPSLSIKEIDDRVLMHCFGGCETSAVLAAVGLNMSDLFPQGARGQFQAVTCPRSRCRSIGGD